MIIIGIETSCDETAVAIIEGKGDEIRVLANITRSQIEIHRKYGGVFPMMAKREHSKNLIPILKKALKDTGFLKNREVSLSVTQNHSHILKNVRMILERESDLLAGFLEFVPAVEKPPVDVIAFTFGPGLEPALWVGVNFAKALSSFWKIPLVPVNHMEGHIVSALLSGEENLKLQNMNSRRIPNHKSPIPNRFPASYRLKTVSYPTLALLVSGGHTELVLVKKPGKYQVVGETLDDAAGEAFDKTARILGLPYPGGPEITRLAGQARNRKLKAKNFSLPRPMLHSGNYNFSFSGLKTAILSTVKTIPKLTSAIRQELAREFEDAVTEVLISKTAKAIREFEAETLIIAGGVIANQRIRAAFEELRQSAFPNVKLLVPEVSHSTDNALMIALAAYLNLQGGGEIFAADKMKTGAEGRARLA